MKTKEVLKRAIITKTPIIIWGEPGVGKTAMIKNVAKEIGRNITTVIASLHEPTDFNGLPVVAEGGVKFVPPEFLTSLKDNDILFLDEISNAPYSVQSALLRLILERVVGDYKLPEVSFVCAANPIDTATEGWGLRPPLANRLLHVNYKLDPTDWARNFPNYWGCPPAFDLNENIWREWRTIIAAFISVNPQCLFSMPADESKRGMAWASPRSWDNVSRILAVEHPSNTEIDELAELVIAGVGEGVGYEFITWFKNLDLPEIQKVLNNPSLIEDLRQDQIFVVAQNLVNYFENNITQKAWEKSWNVIFKIAESWKEIAALSAKSLLEIKSKARADFKTPDRVVMFKNIIEKVISVR